MARGVEPVEPAGENGDRGPARRQCRPVRSAVDPVRPSRDDRDTPVGQPGGDLDGDVLAVTGGGPSADQGDRLAERRELLRLSADPQRRWGVVAEVGQLRRPQVVGRREQADSEPSGLSEGDLDR